MHEPDVTMWATEIKKHRDVSRCFFMLHLVGRHRFELWTYGLRVRCSTS